MDQYVIVASLFYVSLILLTRLWMNPWNDHMIYGNIFAVPSKTHQSIDGKKRNLNRTVSFSIKNLLLDLLAVWFRIHTIFSAVKPLCVGDEPCFMTSLNFIDMLWTNIKVQA